MIITSWVLLSGCALLNPGSSGTAAPPGAGEVGCPEISAERASLVAVPFLLRRAIQDAARVGLVPVRFVRAGCGAEMEVVDDCRIRGRYSWRPKVEDRQVVLRNSAALQKRLSLSSGALIEPLKKAGGLRIEERVAGSWRAPKGVVFDQGLAAGAGCQRASHVLTVVELGGYSVLSGPVANLDRLENAFVAEAARDPAVKELSRAGDVEACAHIDANKRPAQGCDHALAVRLAPLLAGGNSVSVSPLVQIPAGPAPAGGGAGGGGAASGAQLAAFSIDRSEVQTADYERCVADKKCKPSGEGAHCNRGKLGRGDHPINCVSYEDAADYCNWAGKRLPTEAEWVRAAQGAELRTYVWGEAWPPPAGAGNFADATAEVPSPNWAKVPSYSDGFPWTAPVGTFTGHASPEGVLDLAGNVAEWTEDLDTTSGRRDPKARVVRGSSFGHARPEQLRIEFRAPYVESTRSQHIGFRCALSGGAGAPETQ